MIVGVDGSRTMEELWTRSKREREGTRDGRGIPCNAVSFLELLAYLIRWGFRFRYFDYVVDGRSVRKMRRREREVIPTVGDRGRPKEGVRMYTKWGSLTPRRKRVDDIGYWEWRLRLREREKTRGRDLSRWTEGKGPRGWMDGDQSGEEKDGWDEIKEWSRQEGKRREGRSTLKVLFSSCSSFPCTKDKKGGIIHVRTKSVALVRDNSYARGYFGY